MLVVVIFLNAVIMGGGWQFFLMFALYAFKFTQLILREILAQLYFLKNISCPKLIGLPNPVSKIIFMSKLLKQDVR